MPLNLIDLIDLGLNKTGRGREGEGGGEGREIGRRRIEEDFERASGYLHVATSRASNEINQ